MNQRPMWIRVIAAASLGLALTGCGRQDTPVAAAPDTRRETMAWGPITLEINASPARVALERDLLLTIRYNAPSEMDVQLPSLVDRLEGFALAGSYAREPETTDGHTTRELHVRLTPMIADRYRIAPFAVRYTDHSVTPPLTGWFPTEPLVFERDPLVEEPAADIAGRLKPVWIRPTFRSVALSVLAVVAVVILLIIVFRILTRVREHVTLQRMSPRERALRELKQLLATDLLAKNHVKHFYVELTFIVRRYIERQHHVRAPEQTTDEFLLAASRSEQFKPAVLDTLKAFLLAADRVKFAAHLPSAAAIEQAVSTARNYIETDADVPTPRNRDE
ncbi:MAG: hypothetical protein O3A51_04820 [Verrucomicrobia bacterium]|nr:hypothetical protein [Verrucomicrobiota bacterium]